MAQRLKDTPEYKIRLWPEAEGASGSGQAGKLRRKHERKAARQGKSIAQRLRKQAVVRSMERKAVGIARSVAGRFATGAVGELIGLGRGVAATVSGGPVTMILAASALIGVVAYRGISGKTFEQTGMEISDLLLGDTPVAALSAEAARNVLSTPQALAHARAHGQMTPELLSIFHAHKKLAAERIAGEREIAKQIGVNSFYDLAADKLWQLLTKANNMSNTVDKLVKALRIVRSMVTSRGWFEGFVRLGIYLGQSVGVRR